mmetsp:Transcript_27261/g.62580  ORF Transcript_27261/g.62580 Transcript_27261/m.62580 type:complete len:219 (+) Transcript_27261:2655-3311(+)
MMLSAVSSKLVAFSIDSSTSKSEDELTREYEPDEASIWSPEGGGRSTPPIPLPPLHSSTGWKSIRALPVAALTLASFKNGPAYFSIVFWTRPEHTLHVIPETCSRIYGANEDPFGAEEGRSPREDDDVDARFFFLAAASTRRSSSCCRMRAAHASHARSSSDVGTPSRRCATAPAAQSNPMSSTASTTTSWAGPIAVSSGRTIRAPRRSWEAATDSGA